VATLLGSLGLFATCFFLFIRFLPMISIFEMRTILPEAHVKEAGAA
jgi:molybdopterin-containing oxidoreductase family membrane subunit